MISVVLVTYNSEKVLGACLASLRNSGAENATHAALVSHPHPMFGGTMHNKVVFHAMKALSWVHMQANRKLTT